MGIDIALITGKLKQIAQRIDCCGVKNNKIDDGNEYSLFRPIVAFSNTVWAKYERLCID